MYVSANYLRINHLGVLPKFLYHTYQSKQQLKSSPGFVDAKFRITGPLDYWHMTAWESKKDMVQFRDIGAHREAMKDIKKIGKGKVAAWEATTMPSWKEAEENVAKYGRPIQFSSNTPHKAQNPFTLRMAYAY